MAEEICTFSLTMQILLTLLLGQLSQGMLPPLPIGEYVIYGLDTFRVQRSTADLLPSTRLAPSISLPSFSLLPLIPLTPLKAPPPPVEPLESRLRLSLGIGIPPHAFLSSSAGLRTAHAEGSFLTHYLPDSSTLLLALRGRGTFAAGKGTLQGELRVQDGAYSMTGTSWNLLFQGPGNIRLKGVLEGLRLPFQLTWFYGELKATWAKQSDFREWGMTGGLEILSAPQVLPMATAFAFRTGWLQGLLKYRINLGAAYTWRDQKILPRLQIGGTLRLREGLSLSLFAEYRPVLPRLYPVSSYLPLDHRYLPSAGARGTQVFSARFVALSLGWSAKNTHLLVQGTYGRRPFFTLQRLFVEAADMPFTLWGLFVEEAEGLQLSWKGSWRREWGTLETQGMWHNLGEKYLLPYLRGSMGLHLNFLLQTKVTFQIAALSDTLLHVTPNLWLEKEVGLFAVGLFVWNLLDDAGIVPRTFDPWAHSKGRTWGIFLRLNPWRSP